MSAALRARPQTLAELAEVAKVPTERASQIAQTLADLRLLDLDGDRIVVPTPEAPIAALISATIAEQRERLGHIDQLLGVLPVLSRDWRFGDGAQEGISPGVEILHGSGKRIDFWEVLIAQTVPAHPRAVFPDPATLIALLEGLGSSRSAELGAGGLRSRVLVSATGFADSPARRMLEGVEAVGIELRTAERLPSWFYLDDGVAVLPLEWGTEPPTTIGVVRDPAMLAITGSLFETLWAASSPLPGHVGGADPVLALMAQGLSDGAIGSALDLSVRTVRRRIAEASEEWGAASRFALGVAWARREGVVSTAEARSRD